MNSVKGFSLKAILWKACLIASVLALVGVSVALAASGDLDTTFHGTGKYKLDIVAGQYNDARAVAIQADGKIVTVGQACPSYTVPMNCNIILARFTKLGALDTTFNATGKKVVDLGAVDQGFGLVIDPATGKIIVAGQKCTTDGSTCDVAVLRFNPYGSLDTTFNGTGKRIDDFGGGDNGSFGAIALQSGKIVVGGYMFNKITKNYDFAVYRYTSTGALDLTFNGSGKMAIPFAAGRYEFIQAIAIQPTNGKIVLGGETCGGNVSSTLDCNFALARLNPNGALDITFSGDGKQTTDFGGHDWIAALALQPDGKIVAAGGKNPTPTTGYFALARYKADGSLDPTFNVTGKKVLDFSGTAQSEARAVRVVPSTGKILACGWSKDNFALARFTITGALDTTFHGTGKVTVDFVGDDLCRALAIQPLDGKYLLAGSSAGHTALARILP